jgi:predicted dehydrogenase
MSYNTLIIGAGNKGALSDAPGTGNEHKYLSYAHAVKEHEGFELMGFADRYSTASNKAVDIWGSRCFCAPEEYCEECEEHFYHETDVFIIATPDNCHYEALKAIEDIKPKLVICEKPLCTNLQQAREIVELYRQKNIPILVDYTRRFIPEWRKHKAAIDSGEYGKLITAYGRFNDSYMNPDMPAEEKRRMAWFHTGSHMVDTALWLTGSADFDFQYVPSHYKWLYQWMFCFEKSHVSETVGDFTKEKVNTIYDPHLMYVVENAYQFLEGKEPLLCTGEDALKTLEECYKLMEGAK